MKLDITKALAFVSPDAVKALEPSVATANKALEEGTCAGNDFLGWMHLPSQTSAAFLAEINECANVLRQNCEAIVVAGIGGSYLGARAVLEALGDNFGWLKPSDSPRILFAGNNISEDYLAELVEYLHGKKFRCNFHDTRNACSILGGKGGDSAHSVYTVHGHCFDISLNSSASAGITSCDR